jgi:hypothetical protein
MDDAEMYLMAESNPLAGSLRAERIARGLMPVDPMRPDDELIPGRDDLEESA